MPLLLGAFASAGGGTPVEATVLLVAGGGSGGGLGGGGGGGGVIPNSSVLFIPGDTYSIFVGDRGANVGAGDLSTSGGRGGNTTLAHSTGTLTAQGGGGGVAYGTGTVQASSNGGSGGGSNNQALRGLGTPGQGNDAQPSQCNGVDIAAGGGAGYSGTGTGPSCNRGGSGGEGYSLPTDIRALSPFSGMTVVSSGGGGGTRGSLGGGRGIAGTGAGYGSFGNESPGNASSYGSGGGGPAQDGGSMPWQASGFGKSGVAVIKYPTSFPAAISTTGTVDYTVSGGFRYYTFYVTGSGSITF
jgi:hypothetical protein